MTLPFEALTIRIFRLKAKVAPAIFQIINYCVDDADARQTLEDSIQVHTTDFE